MRKQSLVLLIMFLKNRMFDLIETLPLRRLTIHRRWRQFYKEKGNMLDTYALYKMRIHSYPV